MKLWRIVARKWALDKLCDGARLHGGRWNPIGYPAMYAGTTIEICALEKFVHLGESPHPPLVLVSIEIPDEPSLQFFPKMKEFPADWAELPSPASAQEFGRKWLEAADQLVMFLPSAIIPETMNALINPRHTAYQNIKLEVVRDFTFDARMFKFRA